jgi:ferredoxin
MNPVWLILLLYVVIAVLGVFVIYKLTKDRTKRVSSLRLFIQVAAVVAVFMGLIIGPFNVPLFQPLGPSPRDQLVGAGFLDNQFPDGLSIPILACYYPNGRTVTCPIWQLQAYIFPYWNYPRGYMALYSTSGIEMLGIVIGLTAVAAVVLGRFFCGWLCPLGLYQDILTRIRKALRLKHIRFSDKTNTALGQSRYVIIAAFLILSVIFGSYAIFGHELIPGTAARGGGAGVEAGIVAKINEPFCLVCPARPLCILVEEAVGAMKWSYTSQITYGPLWMVGSYVTSINLAVLIVVSVLALVFKRLWCRICPLGALTALFSSFTPFKQVALTKLTKNEQKCTKCGVCKRVCPTEATQVYDKKGGDVTESRCILCARCVELCPYEGALDLKFAGQSVMKSRNWLEPSKSE